MAAKDYRAKLLDSVDTLLKPNGMDEVRINDCVTYVGPSYFEAESMNAEDHRQYAEAGVIPKECEADVERSLHALRLVEMT